jgi:alpha-galactosidase
VLPLELDHLNLMQEIYLDFFTSLDQVKVKYWSSRWGTEWEPQEHLLNQELKLVADTGRSSEKYHPFCILSDSMNSFAIAIPWSGNWSLSIQRDMNRIKVIVDSDNPDIKAITAHSESSRWQDCAAILLREFRGRQKANQIPEMKIEWNHWWPYEDKLINEEIFLRNAQVAQECGIEVAVLDSGWFGAGNWEDARGDWSDINLDRFPSGLSSLAEKTRAIGVDFGIWFEPETVGLGSRAFKQHPDFLAQREGVSLNLLCLGNPDAFEWILSEMQKIIDLTNASWIKIDFNISPELGCDRDDHGHPAHEGHFRHVENFYELLRQIRLHYPKLTIENCSSGGLRWDYGVAELVDFGFSSDRDWPEHALSVFWAYTHFFPVEKFLGWCDSQWLGDQPNQNFSLQNVSDENYFHFIFGISLLGGFGISQRLEDFNSEQRQLLKKYVEVYKKYFRPKYQDQAVVKHLSDQPLRDNLGPRTVAFALESPNRPVLVCIFQLSGAKENKVQYPVEVITGDFKVKNLITQAEQIITAINNLITFEIEIKPNSSFIFDVSPI